MKGLKWTLIVLGVLALLVSITGNKHLYKGLYDTYLQGRKKPAVDDPDLFYTRKIEAHNGTTWPLSKSYNTEQFSSEIQTVNESHKTLAFLVIKNDSLVFEQYLDGHSKEATSNSFSMAKTFLSIITGCAIKDGKLALTDNVHQYLPEYVQEKDTALTVEHLLNMTSGMNFDESYGDPFGFMAKAYYGTNLKELLLGYHLVLEPGTRWEYLGGNNLLLSILLEKVLGEKVSDYAERKIWQPAGMVHDAEWILDGENGDEKTFSGLYATARDFAKIGALYMHQGNLNGHQIVDSNYVQKSIEPVNVKDINGNIIDYYGYAWWKVKHKGLDIFYMQGILGQYVFCIPEKKMMIVRLGRKRMEKSNEINPDDLFLYLDEGLRIAQ